MDSNQQDLVAQFTGITGASPASAQAGLEAANWDLQDAVQLFFAAQEDPQEEEEDDDEPTTSASHPAPAQSSSSSANPPRQRRQQMTLDELKKMSSDAEGDEDDDKQQDMFAGGEKSGLAVQNPDQAGGSGSRDHFQNIMRQAQQNRERPAAAGEEAEPPRPSNFHGRAQTLGGEGAESQVVEDPLQRARDRMQRQQRERVTRTMHLWQDGVSIDDGPLFRFDDPANQAMVEQINRGRAPMQLLDVQPDQEVDLTLEPHKDEPYVQPKKSYKPFGGQGQRLGSPAPGPEPSSSSTAATSAPAGATPAPATTEQPKPEVDESAPTLQLQIRLADGTRLPSRFNTTHTIGDVYHFVNRASPDSNQRAYALMTTFPSKELDDKSQVLGDMGEFKRGGVVVQKWK